MTDSDRLLQEAFLKRYYQQLERHRQGLRKNLPECDKLIFIILLEKRNDFPYRRAGEPQQGFFGESARWVGQDNCHDLFELLVERWDFPTTDEKKTRATVNATLSDLHLVGALRRREGLFDYNEMSPATMAQWMDAKVKGRRERNLRGQQQRAIRQQRKAVA